MVDEYVVRVAPAAHGARAAMPVAEPRCWQWLERQHRCCRFRI